MIRRHAVRSAQDIGVLIAQARRKRGLSQRQLSAEFGATQAWVSRVERGYQKTRIGQVLRLAVYLGIELTAQMPSTQEVGSESVSPGSPSDYPDINTLV